jgi:inward rectifier potassium channel
MHAPRHVHATQVDPENQGDLGLGSRVSSQRHIRILNRDGSFNVRRIGIPNWFGANAYHRLITMSWVRFYLLIATCYVGVNLLFAQLYVLSGPGALAGSEATTYWGRFLEAFFLSVQTLATIGYGALRPQGLAANVMVSIEALTGLLGFALATGILFARFSRPTARLLLSRNALIAPYEGGTALMFRLLNARASELSNVKATVTLTRIENGDPRKARKYHQLRLARESVVLMPMQWVVVHPIDEHSPLHGWTKERLAESDTEVLILLSGVDETFAQTVHTRSSYKQHEIVWGAKFRDIFGSSPDGVLTIDGARLDEYDEVVLP